MFQKLESCCNNNSLFLALILISHPRRTRELARTHMLLANDKPSLMDGPRSELAIMISCFWIGLSQATNRSEKEVTKNATKMLSQTHLLNGLNNVPIWSTFTSASCKIPIVFDELNWFWIEFTLYKIPSDVCRNGIEKSTTLDLAAVIVKSATAKSASWKFIFDSSKYKWQIFRRSYASCYFANNSIPCSRYCIRSSIPIIPNDLHLVIESNQFWQMCCKFDTVALFFPCRRSFVARWVLNGRNHQRLVHDWPFIGQTASVANQEPFVLKIDSLCPISDGNNHRRVKAKFEVEFQYFHKHFHTRPAWDTNWSSHAIKRHLQKWGSVIRKISAKKLKGLGSFQGIKCCIPRIRMKLGRNVH